MRVSIIQHAPFEGLGRIAEWLEWRGLGARVHALYDGAPLPRVEDFDLLILLGGPMSSDEEEHYHWLADEKRLVAEALGCDKRLLGIELGGQLIAQALGAKVRQLDSRQVGWWPLEQYPQAKRSPLGRMLPQHLVALHWHERVFELPDGAIPLYGSAVCDCLGFIWQERAIALQCHFESTAQSVESLLAACGDGLAASGWLQDANVIRQGEGLCNVLRTSVYRILDYLSGPHAVLR